MIEPSKRFGKEPPEAVGHPVQCPCRPHHLPRHGLQVDPALVLLGRIVRDADVPPSRTRRPEAVGLDAVIRGFQVSTPDDQEKLRRTAPHYETLYDYCRAKAAEQPPKQGMSRPTLRYRKRVALHLTGREDEPDVREP